MHRSVLVLGLILTVACLAQAGIKGAGIAILFGSPGNRLTRMKMRKRPKTPNFAGPWLPGINGTRTVSTLGWMAELRSEPGK